MSERFYQWKEDRLILRIKVHPRAQRDAFAGEQDGWLKLRIAAPPVDGKGNARLIAFLAEQFGVPKRNIELMQGEGSRDKRLAIRGATTFPAELGITRP